ncbi:MAG: protein-tyrosine-phosphatase [Saprospiraceae bacterium]|nr:protein-tyrosine-phosphatase [Saprospiraceae bacterium]
MFRKIRRTVKNLEQQFDQIDPQRKLLLERLSAYLQAKYDANEEINLVFVCTHNSRRSHFGQIAGAMAAAYYCIDNVHVFSGGTEATTFHPNAITALRHLGFEISTNDGDSTNPFWTVRFGTKTATMCYSKVYHAEGNPTSNFAAIMTCADADENCPFIPGADIRVATTYEDPKTSDGTAQQDEVYQERFLQICREMLYAFSLVS